MYLIATTYESGSKKLEEFSEEQMFNQTIKNNQKAYKIRNLIFKDGFIKFSGKKLTKFNRNHLYLFPEIEENSTVRNSGGFMFNDTRIIVGADAIEKYYDRFINIGSIENRQESPDKYNIPESVLLIDRNPKDPFRIIAHTGNIEYVGVSYASQLQ